MAQTHTDAIRAVAASNAKAEKAKPVKPIYELTLAIEGLKDIGGGMFTLLSEQMPTNIDPGAIISTLEEQDVEPQTIDEALEAVHAVLHKAFVTKLFGKRVRFQGVEQVDHIR